MIVRGPASIVDRNAANDRARADLEARRRRGAAAAATRARARLIARSSVPPLRRFLDEIRARRSAMSTMASRMKPSPSASGRSPLLVSSAMVVVITRVTPSMLPPTIITAPTSEAARPKPASTIVTSEIAQVPQQRADGAESGLAERAELLAVFVPRVVDDLARQRGDRRRDQDRLRDHHRRRREQDAPRAERPGARQQQVDDEADDHRRQAHQRVQHDDRRPPAGEAVHRDGAPSGSPMRHPITTALRLTRRLKPTIATSFGSAATTSSTACAAASARLFKGAGTAGRTAWTYAHFCNFAADQEPTLRS